MSEIAVDCGHIYMQSFFLNFLNCMQRLLIGVAVLHQLYPHGEWRRGRYTLGTIILDEIPIKLYMSDGFY